MRDEVRRGVRVYGATAHPTTGASPSKLMFGWELRGKFPEVNKPARAPDDNMFAVATKNKKRK